MAASEWNVPLRPVKPWQMTFVFASMRIAIAKSLYSVLGLTIDHDSKNHPGRAVRIVRPIVVGQQDGSIPIAEDFSIRHVPFRPQFGAEPPANLVLKAALDAFARVTIARQHNFAVKQIPIGGLNDSP